METLMTSMMTSQTLSVAATERATSQLELIHHHLQSQLELGAHTSTVLANNTSPAPVTLLNIADTLSERCNIQEIRHLLADIIQSPELLEGIAARSYWHGNGFLKVVLLDRGYKLRLHIWFQGSACEENIHSHRWGFASHILTGALKSELWADAANEDADTITATEYRYTAEHKQHLQTIKATKEALGNAVLAKQQDVTQLAGSSYIMTEDQLHRINHPGQELVATIICTAPTEVLTNRLFPTTDHPKLHPKKLTAAALKDALTDYLEQICPVAMAA